MKIFKVVKEMNTVAQAIAGLVGFAVLIVSAVGIFTFNRIAAAESALGDKISVVQGQVAMNAQRIDKKILRDDEVYFKRRLREIEDDYMVDGKWVPGTKQSTKDDYDYFAHQLERVQRELRKYDKEPEGLP